MTNVERTVEDNKETNLWKARMAQEANRYEDMARSMKRVAEIDTPMTKDENIMLAVAYKQVLDSKRSSRKILALVEHKSGIGTRESEAARHYRALVDNELRALCAEALIVIGRRQMYSLDSATSVFYWKLCGDYNRYSAEATDDPNERAVAVAESRDAYERADGLGRVALLPIDPIRLGLMLNYSVFLYQVCQQRRRGYDLAKQAFDDAVADIDAINQDTYNDSTLILRLIRNNLNIWVDEGLLNDDNDDKRPVMNIITPSASTDVDDRNACLTSNESHPLLDDTF